MYYDLTAMEKLILLISEYLCLYQMELPEYNNIVMKNNAWRNISFAMRLPYYFSGYSISKQPRRLEHTLPSQALTPGCFQLALVDTGPDCFYLQLHIQPVFFFLSSTFLFKSELKTVLCLKIK